MNIIRKLLNWMRPPAVLVKRNTWGRPTEGLFIRAIPSKRGVFTLSKEVWAELGPYVRISQAGRHWIIARCRRDDPEARRVASYGKHTRAIHCVAMADDVRRGRRVPVRRVGTGVFEL